MIVRQLTTASTSKPWTDPTIDEPSNLVVTDDKKFAAQGVLLTLGEGSDPPTVRVTQYRVGERQWRFRVEITNNEDLSRESLTDPA